MNPIQCLIIDDEPLAREIIQTHLNKMHGWEVVGTCMSAGEAYEVLLKSDVDVIFLDIQMPVISGIDFLRSLKKPPLIVFTTAYYHYAVEGFELNVVDYLMKPITIDRFFQALEKVKEKLLTKDLIKNETPYNEVNFIFIKHNGRLLKIKFNDILYVKAEKDFSTIYTREKKYFVSMQLKLLEEVLPESLFTRVHRSFIIHHSMITSIYGNTIKIDEIEIPIGSNFKEALYRKLHID